MTSVTSLVANLIPLEFQKRVSIVVERAGWKVTSLSIVNVSLLRENRQGAEGPATEEAQ